MGMKILALDTTAGAASAALTEDGFLVGETFVNCGFTHSQTVMPMVEHLLQTTRTPLSEVDCLAVAAGPGSFTGVRIGIATVKGLALPEEKPCLGVSTLKELAWNLRGYEGILCPVMDARCKQVYHALFESDGENVRRLSCDQAISISTLGERLRNLKENIFLVGDGAVLCYNNLKSEVNHLRLAPEGVRYQRASSVAFVAEELYRAGLYTDGERLAPVYLRLPQAERELRAKERVGL